MADHAEGLARLLQANPGAFVAAADEIGLFLPPMPFLAQYGCSTLEGDGAIQLIAGQDRVAMLRAWESCLSSGHASVQTTLRNGDGGEFHFFDVRERHGALVVVLLRTAAITRRGDDAGLDPVPVTPRFAVTYRNERASFVAIDEAVTGMLGWSFEELQEAIGLELIHPDDQDRALENWLTMLAEPGRPHRWRGRHRRKDGSWLWVEFTTYNELADEGHVRSELYDISGEMAAMDALEDRERLLREIAEAMPVGVIRFDHRGRVLYANHHSLELLGTSVITHTDDLLRAIAPGDAIELASLMGALGPDNSSTGLQVHLERAEGLRHIDCSVRRLGGRSGDASDAVMTLFDVTESVRLRNELEHRAATDGLTNTLNRSAALARLAHSPAGTVVVYLDIDHFKEINDSHGHIAGDEVLCSVVRQLSSTTGSGGFVGRLGGDEFIVVATGVPDARAALEFGRTLAAAAAHEVPLPHGHLSVRASVGVVYSDNAAPDPDSLVARADAAMYRSKQTRRGEAVLAEMAASSER